MDLDVVFLGTAASMPTAQRGASAILVRRGGERLLFDCGEGTQRQLQRSTVGLPDIQEIFLTHFHADHFLGLPGMLKTFALRGRDDLPLTVYGPPGLKSLFAALKPFLDSRKDLAVVRNLHGTTVFPRLLKGTVEQLHKLLREKYETSVVPGSYFGQAEHFRLGIGGDTQMTAEGLHRLGQALDELS